MAAVAGAVADHVLHGMRRAADCRKIVVNNGGDIAFHLASGERLSAGIVGDLDRPSLDAWLDIDASQPITLKGIVTRIDWLNPHVWFYINVKDDSGTVTRWGLEMGAPHQLQARGWLRDTMKIGDEVTVQGSLARDGTKRANARTVTTSDGRKLGAASSEGNTPPR